MKLHPDQPSVLNTVTAYGDGFVEVNATRHDAPLLVSPEAPTQIWAVNGFEGLQDHGFEQILSLVAGSWGDRGHGAAFRRSISKRATRGS